MIDVVVAYDRESARLLEETIYTDDSEAAFAKRLASEIAYRERSNVEVVLLSAARYDDLKISHARYFDPEALSSERVEKRSMDALTRRAS